MGIALWTKGAPQNRKLIAYATMPTGLMGSNSVALLTGIEVYVVSARRKMKAWIHVFVLFLSTRLKNLDFHSSKRTPLLPMIPFDIVA